MQKIPEIERLRKAIIKFNKAKKEYSQNTRAGEVKTFDLDEYVDVNFTPSNF